MLTFWSLLLLWNFGQNPKTDKPGEPASKVADVAKEDPPPAKPADSKTPPGNAQNPAGAPNAPAVPPPEPDSEHDKFVRAQAAKLDKVSSVAAEIVYSSRNQDQIVSQKGVYKIGPNNRIRMELAFGEGTNGGKRTYVCDGASAYTIEEFGELRRAQLVKIDRVKPLLDDKNVNDDQRTQIWNGLVPYQKPGEMLRGFLGSMTFTERKDDKLGDREVVRLEGRWRKNSVAMLAGDAAKSIDDVDPRVPRYMTLVLDKATGWPLQMEMFQRLAEVGVVKPFITMKFSKLSIGQTIPESDFKFTPPSNMQVQDATPMIESMLKRLIDQTAAQKAAGQKEKAPAGNPPAAEPKKQP